jgi:hypothetical protein
MKPDGTAASIVAALATVPNAKTAAAQAATRTISFTFFPHKQRHHTGIAKLTDRA